MAIYVYIVFLQFSIYLFIANITFHIEGYIIKLRKILLYSKIRMKNMLHYYEQLLSFLFL